MEKTFSFYRNFDKLRSVAFFSMTSARICQNLIKLILGFATKKSNTLVKNARENDQYRFRTVQNKAIQVFQGYIKKKIVSEVKESRAGSL